MRSLRTSRFVVQTIGLVAVAGLLAGCNMTRTYGTGRSVEAQMLEETVSFGGILGRQKKAPIAYRPRAKLVMPPAGQTANLKTPQPKSQLGANWPRDPDEQRRAQLAMEVATPVDERASREVFKRDQRLSGAYRGQFRKAADGKAPTSTAEQLKNTHLQMSPSQMKALHKAMKNGKSKENELGPDGEPRRRYLTEPPKGYRKAAATAPADPRSEAREKMPAWKRWITF